MSRATRRHRRFLASILEPMEPRVLLSAIPFGADYRDNSEFMLGTVHVNVVLLESNGKVDASTENWTSTMISNVKREITAGLDWWENLLVKQGSKHTLDFQIDFTYADNPVATGYEPIRRAQSEQSLWIDDFLNTVNANSAASIFTDMRQWNHAQRQAHGTDWAFTVFVANSLNDSDGSFSDGYSAYAYLGGPFMVMTYDNGGWNIDRMAEVMAHETGHIFYALDEYPGSSSYTSRSGYYNTQNLNAYDDNPDRSTRVTSLMAEGNLLVNAYNQYTSSPTSLEMLGWRDSDKDGVFDVLDVPLTLTGSGAYDAAAGGFQFIGSSAVGTLANQNPRGARHSITLNTVDQLQYRLNGGEWLAAANYGSYTANINQLIAVAPGGDYVIDLRTIDLDTGVSSNVWSTSFTAGAVTPDPNTGDATTGDNTTSGGDTGGDQTNDAVTPGIVVTALTDLVTSESGGKAYFSVALSSRPTADVVISIASQDTSEGKPNVRKLVFTAANWDVAQQVTVSGANDRSVDGDVSYVVALKPAVSADLAYNGLDAADVTLVNLDNDVAKLGRKSRAPAEMNLGAMHAAWMQQRSATPLLHAASTLWARDLDDDRRGDGHDEAGSLLKNVRLREVDVA